MTLRRSVACSLFAAAVFASTSTAFATRPTSPSNMVGGALTGPVWSQVGGQAAVEYGWSVASAGDVNADGLADAIVGAWRYAPGSPGAAFVYHGTSGGLSTSASQTLLGPQPACGFGISVAGAGDINGDGFDDIVVGAEYFANSLHWEGLASAFYGSAAGVSPSPNWTAESNVAESRYADCVAGAGDVNGDGFDDVLVGAWHYSNGQLNEGAVYYYEGSPSGLPSAQTRLIEGDVAGGYFGSTVAGVGDVNGDGYDDVVIAATGSDTSPGVAGKALLYWGSPSGLSAGPVWEFSTGQAGSQMGVRRIGDINGDGLADIGLSAALYDGAMADEGRIFVFFGRSTIPAPQPDWTLEASSAYARLGMCAGAGDVNGDQVDDLLVGGLRMSNPEPEEGAAFLFLGSICGPVPGPSWHAEGNQAGAQFGHAATGIGDVTNDGLADVMIGARLYDSPLIDEGRAQVFAGVPFHDCNGNEIDDAIDLGTSSSADCNQNLIPDECDIRCGVSSDANGNGVPDECDPTIIPFCFGDGTGFGCPCGSTGDPGHGCLNSFGLLGGGLLSGTGITSVSADTLCLTASSLPPSTTGLCFQGQQQVNGGLGRWFGDGLRCVTANVVRLGSRVASSGSIAWGSCVVGDQPISTYEPVAPGTTRHYQVWYRNAANFCTPSPFNLTNGVTVIWRP